MANTLTNLIPTLFQALDTVAREMVGYIPAVTRNSSAERAAKDETIRFPVVPAISASDITPGQTPADDGDATIGSATLTISKSRYAPVRWAGEEIMGVRNTGQFEAIMRDQFTQAMRVLCNEVEADLAALHVAASRAYGTAGTAPFGTAADFSDFSNVLKILDDNGTPPSERHLVLGSAAINNLRGKQSSLFKFNEAGTDELLRRGIVGQVESFDIHSSGQISSFTKGTGASYQVNNAGPYAIGTTSIAVDTGTGTILAGDVITFTGDTNKYVVTTALAGGTVVIAAPGLRQTLADDVALTVGNSHTPNLAFHRSALQLVTRAPAMPDGGDAADDVIEIQDPVSGLAFQVAQYKLYRRIKYEVGLAWGVKCVKPEFLAKLLG